MKDLAMIIRENIRQFKRGQDPVKTLEIGRNSPKGKEQRFEILKSRFKDIQEDSKEVVMEQLDEYEKVTDNLEREGVLLKTLKITLSSAKFRIPLWKVIKGINVVSSAICQKDAEVLRNQLVKYDFDLGKQEARIEFEDLGYYLYPHEIKEFFERRGWKWEN